MVHKHTCRRCNFSYYADGDRHQNVKLEEHIDKENTKLANKSFTQNQLFEFNNHPSLDELFGLALKNKKFLIEPKESI